MLKQAIYLMPKIAWDSDALAFLTAAGITDSVIRIAINTYVKDLKSNSLWTKFVALYPFVGGTATTHKYNLKDPRDLDVAFRLTFSGGVTHNSNGVTFDGVNGFANTHVIPSANLTLNNESFILYSRTSAATATGNEVDMGAAIGTNQRDQMQIRTSSNTSVASFNSTTATASTTTTNGQGLFMSSRVSSTDLRLYRNGSQIVANSNSNGGSLSNIKIFIGARNVSNAGNGYVNRNFALAGCGSSFTPSESLTFYNLTQTLQTTLNRQV